MKAKFLALIAAGLFVATASKAQYYRGDRGPGEIAYDNQRVYGDRIRMDRDLRYGDYRDYRQDRRDMWRDRRDRFYDRRHGMPFLPPLPPPPPVRYMPGRCDY